WHHGRRANKRSNELARACSPRMALWRRWDPMRSRLASPPGSKICHADGQHCTSCCTGVGYRRREVLELVVVLGHEVWRWACAATSPLLLAAPASAQPARL